MNKKKSKFFKKLKSFSIDEKIETSKFDYCKNLKWFLIFPIVVILVGVILLCSIGFNLGIDFTGGSNMTVYIDSSGAIGQKLDINKDSKEIKNKIQTVLDKHGLQITTFQNTTIDSEENGISKGDAIIVKYQNDNSLTTAEIEEINDQIRLELLKEFGYITDESITTIDDLEDVSQADLVQNGGVTTASASAELMMKSFIALLVAVVLILIYVIIRFEFTSGLAAILALFHDILFTSSIVLICRIQINVSFIAALITILGYSINNTIIIFDRMRDKLKIAKNSNEKIDNNQIANSSVKDTMLRSILTGVTTFIMIFMITVIGVSDIREFAFPIMIGILAGFYSSVFITPGLWAIAYKPRKRKKSKKSSSNGEKSDEVEIVDATNLDAKTIDAQ
jgi:preprotein translocase subunit SecF